MNVAISTQSLHKNTPSAIDRAVALGFSHLEINLQRTEFDYGYRRRPNVALYRSLSAQLVESGLAVWSVTLPQLTQAHMFSARARKEILLNAIGAAGMMQAKTVVVEPAQLFTNEEALESYLTSGGTPPVIDGYDEAWAQLINRRMSLALCNQNYWLGSVLTNQVERAQQVTFDLGIRFSADIPQATQRNQLAKWLETLQDRLVVAHLYDVRADGISKQTPDAEKWRAALTELKQTQLKTLVMHAAPDQSDADIVAAKQAVEAILNE